jgi:two-component system OmpR family response regulator
MHKLRTFVVEDNALVLESLCAALVEIAFVDIVGTADSEQDALSWLWDEANTCDVILVDLYLRSGSGLGVLKGLIALPNRPAWVAVVSNYVSSEVRSLCATLGADKTFDKSNEIDEMLNWLIAAQAAGGLPDPGCLGGQQA